MKALYAISMLCGAAYAQLQPVPAPLPAPGIAQPPAPVFSRHQPRFVASGLVYEVVPNLTWQSLRKRILSISTRNFGSRDFSGVSTFMWVGRPVLGGEAMYTIGKPQFQMMNVGPGAFFWWQVSTDLVQEADLTLRTIGAREPVALKMSGWISVVFNHLQQPVACRASEAAIVEYYRKGGFTIPSDPAAVMR